jgi:hypothetical protein
MARRSNYVRADIAGIDELQAKLRSAEPIYAAPWRKALETATDEVFDAEKQAAGRMRLTGRMEAHLLKRMDARPMPEWGYVSQDAVADTPDRKRGGLFRYPWALNASERFHFRGTGRTTRGWWDRPLQRMTKRVQELLSEAARRIEARWRT